MREQKRTPFSVWLRSRITESGLKQNYIADKIGVNHTTLSEWVCGRRTPRIKAHIRGVAAFFSVSESFVRELL